MLFADLLLATVCLLMGTLGGFLATWASHLRLRRLEFAVADLEEMILREIKKRAAKERWSTEELTKDAEKLLQAAPGSSNSVRLEDNIEKWRWGRGTQNR